ncbi:ABC transporter substrate-binding protein [Streptomyces sp. NPDC048172]|uniref:ABC transporter substrate-binding protein n=1 Tax=Streptomyces sp. NPDC048172 TaxID=3365505 RepID=UPI00370FD370
MLSSVIDLARRPFRRPWGPGEKALAVLLVLAVAAGVTVLVTVPDWGGEDDCPKGVQRVEGQCMAVADGDFSYDKGLRGLVEEVAEENAEASGETYRSVALTMPFTSDATSAMSPGLIEHGLAGALAAQRAANDRPGPKLRLLLADIGKDMKQWRPVVDTLDGLPDGETLIATVGMPSSTTESKQAIKALEKREIPSVGPVITSSDMNAGRFFFKTSPSNAHFTEALGRYLDRRKDAKTGFLVLDERAEDTYSRDLERHVLDAFGKEFDLRRNSASFVGTRGDEAGTPNLFRIPVLNLCAAKADTVFYAGRDEDLPALVERLASAPDCGYRKPLRLVKVGIGLPPELTGKDITARMRAAGIRLVQAASVDRAWTRGPGERPSGYAAFAKAYEAVTEGQDLGGKPLDDGYAVMYYDALTAVSEASGLAYEDTPQASGEPKSPERVRKDVHNKLLNLNPDRRGDAEGCNPCVEGAGGTYGFNPRASAGLWPVCKGVHILEYPAPKGGPTRKDPPYRTYGSSFSGVCPKGL